ncbi:8549_t:CDS:1, partial [Dentiscutata erythropus]
DNREHYHKRYDASDMLYPGSLTQALIQFISVLQVSNRKPSDLILAGFCDMSCPSHRRISSF